jgi:hypothetical protein
MRSLSPVVAVVLDSVIAAALVGMTGAKPMKLNIDESCMKFLLCIRIKDLINHL